MRAGTFLKHFETAGGPAAAWRRRVRLDGALAALLFLVMFDRLTGNLVHETAGLLMLLPVLLHVALNRRWCRRALELPARGEHRRRTSGRELFLRCLNLFLALAFVASLGSGLVCSQTIAAPATPDLWRMDLDYRAAHVGLSIWFFIAAALHAGLHASAFTGRAKAMIMRRLGTRALLPCGMLATAAAAALALSSFETRQADLLMLLQSAYIPVERGEWALEMPLELASLFFATAGSAALLDRGR